MNNEAINKRIQALETELAGLKAELAKPEKFEFKYTERRTYFISETEVDSGYKGTQPNRLENFRYRQTEENSQADFQLQKELMCISAIAEQIDPNYKSKLNWDSQDYKYSISYDVTTNTFIIESCVSIKPLGVVYMPKNVAEQVCKILNEKQVIL